MNITCVAEALGLTEAQAAELGLAGQLPSGVSELLKLILINSYISPKVVVLADAITADNEYALIPGKEYAITIADNGTATVASIQYWNGLAFVDYTLDDGTTNQGYIITAPPSGRVKVDTNGQLLVSITETK